MEGIEPQWQHVLEQVEQLGQAKIQDLLRMENATQGWEDLGVHDDTHSYRLKTDTGLYIVKGAGDLDFPAEAIREVVKDNDRKKEWDQMYMGGRVVKVLTPHSNVSYEQFSAPWPVSNRDFCFGVYEHSEADCLISACASLELAEVPEVRGFVRGHMEFGGFIYRKLSDTRTHLTYIIYVDPRGSIPTKIINMSQKKQAQNVAKIRAFMQRSA